MPVFITGQDDENALRFQGHQQHTAHTDMWKTKRDKMLPNRVSLSCTSRVGELPVLPYHWTWPGVGKKDLLQWPRLVILLSAGGVKLLGLDDLTSEFCCRLMRQKCLSAASQGFSAATFEMPWWNSVGISIKFIWQMCLSHETGHTASVCSVLLPGKSGFVPAALAQASVPAVSVALLPLSFLCYTPVLA